MVGRNASNRAVLYGRVSTDDQAENGTSLDEQLSACEVKSVGIEADIVAVYTDPGVSGYLLETRPGIQSALRDIEAGRANVLIVYNLSRLSRNREHQSLIKRRVETAGGRLVFCDMSFEDTPAGEFAFNVMGDYYHFERQLIRDRTMKGKRRRASEDKQQPARSVSPYGYHIVTRNDVIAGRWPAAEIGAYKLVEGQAFWVRTIFSKYAQGASLRDVARHLYDNGISAPKGGACWCPKSLRNMILNTVYKGVGTYCKTRWQRVEVGQSRKVIQKPVPEHDRITIPAPAIVDDVTWEACQTRLKNARAVYGGRPDRKHPLSGLLVCPECGRKMAGHGCRKREKAYRYYHCQWAFSGRSADRQTCHRTQYNAERVEALTITGLREVACTPGLLQAALTRMSAHDTDHQSGDAEATVRAALARIDQKESILIDAMASAVSAGASADTFARKFGEIAAERARLTARLEAIGKSWVHSSHCDVKALSQELSASLADIDEALHAPELTASERHDLVASVVNDIRPIEGGIEIDLKSPWRKSPAETVTSIKMHAYRDAIVRQGEGVVDAAWCLFPGPAQDGPVVIAYPASSEREPFGRAGVGAVRMRPGEDHASLARLIALWAGAPEGAK
jgi:site-specific DNA recombinase